MSEYCNSMNILHASDHVKCKDKDGNVDVAKYMKIVYGEVKKYLIHKNQ